MLDVNYENRVTTALIGAKEEGLAIVNILNKLIVSCKEAVRIPIFLVSLGYFRSFAPIVHSMLKLKNHFRLVLLVY